MTITLDSNLLLAPLNIRKDKKNYIIEDIDSGEFYEMPEVCVEAINLITVGKHLGDIEKKLKDKYPNDDVDLLDFAEQLLELQLIEEIDGVKVERQVQQKEPLGFSSISPKVGKFFFNKISYLLYLSLLVVNIILVIVKPSLFPHYKDIFVFDIMVLNVVVWMTISFILVLIHEFGHILAMRAHNLPTKLGIGHRLFFVVFETDMSSIWRLPSKDRNVLFLAGLCFDTVILFIALICQLIFPNGISLSLTTLAVFDIFTRIVFQCCIYMKTDLYFVFENVSGCYNLIENANQTIRKWFPFLKFSAKDEVEFESERRTIFFYSIFCVVGVGLTIFLYAKYYIPEIIHAAKILLPGYLQSPTSLVFWDAVVFTLQVGIFLLLLLNSWRKKYLKY
ncbi:hypothetical protein J1P26_12990 [Neobacillus sp. MM2021_6]|uniref:hypothetical protein n=1 Tax=Bacillaceae TaxID=186817 RepID=UPI00140DB877|nr:MULTISPECIES: hypothetical protein [Bacillaceae]MBO0960614.1 hypothetical protein [Neobacillus sp. MM2021_6]NHC18336.1 hypothetical protein [Bacillus sp. MM2020_4]